jgi:hypothetical protein
MQTADKPLKFIGFKKAQQDFVFFLRMLRTSRMGKNGHEKSPLTKPPQMGNSRD